MPTHPSLLPLTFRVLCLVFCVFGVVGCVASESARSDRQTLETGFTQYSARQFDKSYSAADEYIRKNPNAANIDEAYYLRGLSRMSRNSPTEKTAAAQDLQTAIAKTKRSDLKAKANRALGDIAYDASRWPDAATYYQKSLATAPASSLSPAATVHINYRLGTCHQNLGQWTGAKPYFQKVITSNADPAYTRSALARIDVKSFSLQFGAFRDQPNAAALVKQLKSSILATVITEMRDGQLLYFVRFGSYPTFAEAQSARTRFLPKYPKITISP
ncbi:MAG: SPOR domain-containing protein [Phycisphaerales bacterium]|nr:SPOR domain-containing protein [Phycisphaerales bacterium]